MGLFKEKLEDGKYHAPGKGSDYELNSQSTADLEKWANDPNCVEQALCAEFLNRRLEAQAKRNAEIEAAKLADDKSKAAKKSALEDEPFDPRTEISADARHIASRIVTHLWILFVLLPIAATILFNILK